MTPIRLFCCKSEADVEKPVTASQYLMRKGKTSKELKRIGIMPGRQFM